MQGRRVYNTDIFEPGDYGRHPHDGVWYACAPVHTDPTMLANLTRHEVIEHPDGTITVSPSILITYQTPNKTITWHGYLEAGRWREC
jgi:hypothetical protein